VLLLCVVCFACISTNMLFYVISYDTPPLVSGAGGCGKADLLEKKKEFSV
jgi:hypothetical protein